MSRLCIAPSGLRYAPSLTGLQTTDSRGCPHDQSWQSDYHLTSGAIHGGRSLHQFRQAVQPDSPPVL